MTAILTGAALSVGACALVLAAFGPLGLAVFLAASAAFGCWWYGCVVLPAFSFWPLQRGRDGRLRWRR